MEEPNPSLIIVIKTFLDGLRFTPPGGSWQFSTGTKNGRISGFGLQFYVDFDKQRVSALQLIRSDQRSMLDGSLEQSISLLQKFFVENVELAGGGELLFAAVRPKFTTVLEFVGDEVVQLLAQKLPNFLRMQNEDRFFMIPMLGIQCAEVISDASCVWWPATQNLDCLADQYRFLRSELVPGQFPPPKNAPGKILLGANDSWLGCYAKSEAAGKSSLRRIAGALFLALDSNKALAITAAKQPAALFYFSTGHWTQKSKDFSLPYLSQPVDVTSTTAEFVRTVTRAAVSDPRIAVMLECCGAAWTLPERDRFIQLSTAIDALFGKQGSVGKSIRESIKIHAIGVVNPEGRAHLLLSIRNSLVHGEAFEIAQCKEYLTYLEKFEISPARDQLLVLRACVWSLANRSY
jgi:hypothetical protein